MRLVVIVVLLAGGAIGFGLYLILRDFTPAVPAAGPALRQLQAPIAHRPSTQGPTHRLRGLLTGRFRLPYRELALIGYSTERYTTEKILFALVGLMFPPVMSLILAVTPLRLGFYIPAAAGLALGALFFVLVDVSIRQRAADAREEFSRHVGVYFNLIALELAASHGPVEALERAASVGGGWVSQRIRDSLETSRLTLEPPWDGLKGVAAEIGVPDLGDVGEIMTLVGDEGAPVYDTLRSASDALHAQHLAKEEERANRATTVLYIPTSLLVFVLFVIAAYPFLVRLATT